MFLVYAETNKKVLDKENVCRSKWNWTRKDVDRNEQRCQWKWTRKDVDVTEQVVVVNKQAMV